MRSLLILCGLVVLCHGQGYNYNAPSVGSISSFGNGGYSSGPTAAAAIGSISGQSIGSGFGGISSGIGSGIISGVSSGIGSGISSGFGSAGVSQSFSGSAGYASQAPIVHKHVYVHVAPEEPEETRARVAPVLPPPTKHYKIIFVKTPSPPSYSAPVIPAQQQNEEKTLVYVLVKKPEDQPDIVVPTAPTTQPSKPEVYFIKYKTQKQAIGGGSVGSVGSVGSIGSVGSGGIQTVISGVSGIGDSDSISVADLARSGPAGGSPAPKYGPPGYQN